VKFKKNKVIINGQRFFYWEKNKKNKEIIILLHGFPGNHIGLVNLANYLSDEYRIIIPDLPACGQSETLKETNNLKNYSKWVDVFLKKLSIDNAIIIGHSFGSRVALVFSVNYPDKVKKLVLITPIVEVDGFIARIASFYYRIAEFLPKYLQKLWLSNKFSKIVGDNIIFKSSNHILHKKIINRDIRELKRINQKVIIELFDEFYKFKLIPLGEKVKTKSLVIASDKDEIATLKSVALLVGKINKSEFKILKNEGHLVPLENPLATAKIINSWLKK